MVFIVNLYLGDLKRSFVNMADRISTPNSSHTFISEAPSPLGNLLKWGLVKTEEKVKKSYVEIIFLTDISFCVFSQRSRIFLKFTRDGGRTRRWCRAASFQVSFQPQAPFQGDDRWWRRRRIHVWALVKRPFQPSDTLIDSCSVSALKANSFLRLFFFPFSFKLCAFFFFFLSECQRSSLNEQMKPGEQNHRRKNVIQEAGAEWLCSGAAVAPLQRWRWEDKRKLVI